MQGIIACFFKDGDSNKTKQFITRNTTQSFYCSTYKLQHSALYCHIINHSSLVSVYFRAAQYTYTILCVDKKYCTFTVSSYYTYQIHQRLCNCLVNTQSRHSIYVINYFFHSHSYHLKVLMQSSVPLSLLHSILTHVLYSIP